MSVISGLISPDVPDYADSVIESLYVACTETDCDLSADTGRRLMYIVRMFDRLELVATATVRDRTDDIQEILSGFKSLLGKRGWTTGQRRYVDIVYKFIIEQHGRVLNTPEAALEAGEMMRRRSPTLATEDE